MCYVKIAENGIFRFNVCPYSMFVSINASMLCVSSVLAYRYNCHRDFYCNFPFYIVVFRHDESI